MEGNQQKMREALNSIVGIAESAFDVPERDREASQGRALSLIADAARDALAAPPRNCDVGTAEEQTERFEAECHRHDHCTPCPVHREWGEFKEGKPKSCQMIWGQMPYEEVNRKYGRKETAK